MCLKSVLMLKASRALIRFATVFGRILFILGLRKKSTERAHFSDIPPQFMEDESLWNNEYICYKGIPLYFSKWAQACINKVGHTFDETGSLLSLDQVRAVVGQIAHIWFNYNAICNVLPSDWRQANGTEQLQAKL